VIYSTLSLKNHALAHGKKLVKNKSNSEMQNISYKIDLEENVLTNNWSFRRKVHSESLIYRR